MGTAKKLRSNKGFTLVELVVVIAVLAILAGVGTVAYRGYITKANEAADVSLLAAVKTAVDAAYAESTDSVTKIVVKNVSTKTAYDTMIEVTVEVGGTGSVSAMDTKYQEAFKTFFAGNGDAKLTSEKYGATTSKGAEWTSAGWHEATT